MATRHELRRVHVESRAIDAPFDSAHEVASSCVKSFGWRPPPAWIEIDREGAIEVVSSALMNHLGSDGPMMPFREAEERARQFVAGVEEEGAVFFTNGALEDMRRGFGRRGITVSKADSGVIAVSRDRVTMFWIEDS